MKAAEIIRATTISRVWEALGGDPPRRGRARAFYRDGDNHQAVSLSDAKACWFDHRDGVGGGVLHLVQRVLGCGRGDALSWLSEYTGIPLDDRQMTVAERTNYARAIRNANAIARHLADFATGLELVTEQNLRRLSDLLIRYNVDPTVVLAKLHREAQVLRTATPTDITAVWRAMRHTNPAAVIAMERIGREHREDTLAVTSAIVKLLTLSVMEAAA